MQITITGSPKEIAALVLVMQGRQEAKVRLAQAEKTDFEKVAEAFNRRISEGLNPQA